ncbi:putative costunolide synthase [Dioscorea sansibarensis]
MATPLFIIVVVVVVVVFIFSYKLVFAGDKHNLPPSPPALPIIGNLLQLSSHPHRSFHALSQSYGPLMLLHIGQVPTLVVSSPATALDVLKTHDLAFAGRPFSKPFSKLSNGLNVSFSPYGHYWRQTKKLAVVHLLNRKRVRSFHTVRQHQASLMIQKIADSKEEDQVVNVSEVLYEYSNEVVSRVAAGKLGNAAKFREMVEEASVLLGGFQVCDMFPAMGWLSAVMGLDGKLERITRKLDVFLSEIVEEHIERRRQGGSGEVEDFVDLLLALKEEGHDEDFAIADENIKAIIMDMIGAGTDTSYVTLEWAMAELMKNPRTMKKAQDEVRQISNGKPTVSEDDIPQMSYLQAVIKEVLRLHPPPLLLPHESRQKVVLQGYEIPERTRVIINAWSIGRDPNSWEDPEEFKPERFVGSSVDFNGLDFKFIPFGAGRRMCPGINFAITSIEFALASLLYHFSWRLPDRMSVEDLDMHEAPGLTTPRKQSLHLIATPYLPQVFV